MILPETVSRELMARANIDICKVEQGVDPVRLVEHRNDSFESGYAVHRWLNLTAQRKIVAITLRELELFDEHLGRPSRPMKKSLTRW